MEDDRWKRPASPLPFSANSLPNLLPERGGVTAEIDDAESLALTREVLGKLWPVRGLLGFGEMVVHAAQGLEELGWFGGYLTHLFRRKTIGQMRSLAEGRLRG